MLPRLLRRAAFLAVFAASLLSAQQFPLQMVATENGLVATVPNGSILPVSASVGLTGEILVTATYSGSGTVTVTQPPQVLGSTEITATLSGTLPLTLTPGGSFSFTIVFRPTTAAGVSAIVNLPFTETVPPATGTQPVVNTNAINLTVNGTAASFVLSYVKDGNVVPLANGGAMVFDPQPINTTVTLQLNITNNGSAAGQVTALSISGKAFQFVGKPLLPAAIQSGLTLELGVEYTPTAVESDSGQVQITFADGTTSTVNLQGSGTSPALVYTVTQNGKSTTVSPNGTITLPDTNVGSSSTALVRVQNTGNGTIVVNGISQPGAPFAVTAGPVFPKTLNAGDSFTFDITFAPTTPGPQTGELVVGSDLFNLAGNGLGSNLQFSYVADGSKLTIGSNGVTAVLFSQVQVTKSAQIPFTVTNAGTLPSVISSIAVVANNSPFSITNQPGLPKTLAPGASFTFNVNFTPTTIGLANDSLQINSTSIPLSGSGTAPPPLPAYTISAPTGNVAPQTQPSVSLKLASPYPVALNGVLTLTTSGSLDTDPAIQFLTSGRTVPFAIPANGTQANFANQGTQIQLQTGTVAGNITLTPSFATAAGDIPLTPSNPTTLELTIPAAAPVLFGVTEASSTANGIVLSFTGYSTTRSLTSLNIQFTPAAGFTLATGQVTVDLSQAATVWFESSASQGFGGQFTATVPFTFSGTVPTGATLVQTVSSISATISNSVGASNSVTTPVQ